MKLFRLIKRFYYKISRKKIGFYGNFANFESAETPTQTYSSFNLQRYIFEKSIKARLQNKYERDGIIFDNPIVDKYFIEFLKNKFIIPNKKIFFKKVKVLDYGGSFGVYYYSLKKIIHTNFKWIIMEQKTKVALAKKKKKYFKELTFVDKIDLKKEKFDIILFNTSLQYLKNPYEIILSNKKTKYIFIANVILTNKRKDLVKLEYPDPEVYSYKYPCWFLSKNLFQKKIKKNYFYKIKKITNIYKLGLGENYYNILLKKK